MSAGDQTVAAAGPGSLITRRRRLAGLTQQQPADRAAISVGTLRDLEQGRTARPRRHTAETLARILGLDLPLTGDSAALRPSLRGKQPAATRFRVAAQGLRIGELGSLVLWHSAC